ncbi:MAG: thrombospondin type 3 repeat-containing protein [Polyangiaceae bacterium]
MIHVPGATEFTHSKGLDPAQAGGAPRYVVTVPVSPTDGALRQGDSGGALFTTSALSGISFPTNNANEPFALSVVSSGDPALNTANSPLMVDAARGPMLEQWMRELLEDADQDGVPNFRDNCVTNANYFQDNSNLDSERKLYDPSNPTAGRVPQPGETSYSLDFRQHYPGNNCEDNPVAHLTQSAETVRLGTAVTCPLYRDDYGTPTWVSSTGGQCKVQVRGANIAFDGYRAPQFGGGAHQGHVYPSVCLCQAPSDLSLLEKKRWCDINAGCTIAADSTFAGVSDYTFHSGGWTRIHETDVEGESVSDPALLSFDTTFSTVEYRAQPRTSARRTSRWDTQQDLATFGKNPEAALFSAAFWSFAKGPFVQPPSTFPLSTAANRTSSYLYGIVSSFREPYEIEYSSIDLGFLPADLVPYRRAPWYDDGYRLVSDIRTWVLSVPQSGGGVRVFALDKTQHTDVTDHYSGSLRARLGAGTATSVLVSGFGAQYDLPALEVAKEDGDVLSEMKWDDDEGFWKLESVPSGGAMPGALGAVALDDVHKRLWSINDMGTYKYISTRERQWYGPWQVNWYRDISAEIMPSVLFPLVAERAAVGMVIADNKLRFTRYEADQDTTVLWEVPVAAGTYRLTVEPDGVQGGIMTIRRQSNGHALVFLLNHLGLPENGFVIGNHTVVSSVMVNGEGFAYVATQTPAVGKPPLKTVTRSWDNLDDIPTLMQSLAGGF